MPPVFTYLLVLIYTIFGIKTAAAIWALLIIKYLALALAPVFLLRICYAVYPSRAFWVLPIYLLLIFFCFTTFFELTHDVWLFVFLLTLLLYNYLPCIQTPSGRKLGLSWGFLGGLAILTHPMLGLVYFVLTLLGPQTTSRRKAQLIAIALLICAPWFVRNYLVFQRVILVKSNLYFDLYQGNYMDEDGILDIRILHQHPCENETTRLEYTRLGEKDYLALYRQKSFQALRRDPWTYLYKVANRGLHAFILYPIFSPHSQAWPQEKGAIFKYTLKALIYCLPFFITIFLLAFGRKEQRKFIYILALIFFIHLAPYVLISFYRRYRIYLIPILV